ncbi:MAG: hypothetical protein PVSMB4_07970 [Ktedonobacterales bacterium]
MSRRTLPLALAASPGAETATRNTQLRGWRRVAARAAWVFVMAWIVASFAASLPNQLHAFQHPSAHSAELSPGAVAALHQVGVSLAAYAWLAVAFGSLIMLVAIALALVLFWRRGDDWMVLLVSLLFPAYCLLSISPSELFHATPTGSPLAVANTILLATVTFAIIYAVFMLFPSGRFVPFWSWALLVACVIWFAAITAVPTLLILFLGYPIFLAAAVACQIYRYRKVETPVQRQQTRWAVFGLVTALLANQAFWQTAGLTPLSKTIYPPIAYLVLYGSVLLIPVTFFIAIQRYRLYEIDVIVRRTLIYGTLTALLAGVYFAIVLGVQTVARHLTGQTGQQPVVIVATTLLVAALFTPLRRWLQAFIDRAFYRSKYDAARTLAAFGTTLRTETDLDELGEQLLAVVQQTMQPAHVSLWLRTTRWQVTGVSAGEGSPPQ